METYKISQIAKLLGLSSDTIRFYEKKGLVHPSVNPDNQYREYNLDNILELLDIIYYRHLDISLQDIQSICTSKSRENMYELLLKKKQETEEKIRYEQQLLKKLTCISETYQRVESNQNICSIKAFPASVILFESERTSDFFTQQIAHLTQDQFVLCSLFKTYHINSCDIQPKKTIIALEQDIMEELHMDYPQAQLIKAHKQPCVFLVIHMLHSQIQQEDIALLFAYAAKQKLTLQDTLYMREIPLTSYQDDQNYYAELYIPICED
ncbi:MerR family transcriptional regulator [[Clostridium] innocuum]|nr:MerR family transcriptional regulator [[Clostridium] innocuum]MCR0579336.1 MerR family transcriptional regulator [[Clostridium] innocuum]